jgi:hypothetical protein
MLKMRNEPNKCFRINKSDWNEPKKNARLCKSRTREVF